MDALNKIIRKHKKELSTGDTVFFGRYYHKGRRKAPIAWIVLECDENKILLFSKYAIDVMGFIFHWDCSDMENSVKKTIWEFSDLRKWLNDDFYHKAFNGHEKNRIRNTEIQTTEMHADTTNKVFILSEQQAKALLADPDIRCAVPTPYAVHKKALVEEGTNRSPYWILPHIEISGGRSPAIQDEMLSKLRIMPQAISGKGEVYCHSRNVYHHDFTVRPALYINR